MIQLLPEIRMMVPNNHSTYGGIKEKTFTPSCSLLALFLLSSWSLLALFLPSSSSLPPLYTETLPKLSRTYPLPCPFLAPLNFVLTCSRSGKLKRVWLSAHLLATLSTIAEQTRFKHPSTTIHAPFMHHSCTIQPLFNHHSTTIQPCAILFTFWCLRV